MSASLVVISIGPVQEFIATARRTRDFWMGSTILSECARAVARSIAERLSLNALIFPAASDIRHLRPKSFDKRNEELQSELDVSNVILFEAPEGTDIRSLVGDLKVVTTNRWEDMASKAAQRCRSELRHDWERQLKPSPIEFYAAWAPLAGGYASARQQAMRLLAGRKACRDFEPWSGQNKLPKSSLDGARETILLEIDPAKPHRRRGLHVRPGEQLDLIGIVKRADWGHSAIRYPSVSRVAIDPWVRGIHAAALSNPKIGRLLNGILDECKSLGLRGRRERNPWGVEDDVPKFPWLRTFPYEGTVLYASRQNDLVEELLEEAPADVTETVVDADQWARDTLRELTSLVGELGKEHAFSDPRPYLAILAADGDEMGRVLSEIARNGDGAAKHRAFSAAQSAFAREAREIINKKFSGVCVYASADDVLAFVALDQSIECANELRKTFENRVGTVARSLRASSPPTLSVGLAIGHFLDPLEDLLEFARAAEKRAKNPTPAEFIRGQTPRNALAVSIHTRGGAPLTVRDNWEREGVTPFVERIRDWAGLFQRRLLPVKAAYDLRQLAREYPDGENDQIGLDALRVLSRKREHPGEEDPKQKIRTLLANVRSAGDLHVLADELVIGKWIGDAIDEASGIRPSKDPPPDSAIATENPSMGETQ